MTDTTTEAVERLRARLRKIICRIAHKEDVTVLRIPADPSHDADIICDEADKTLCALAQERDAAVARAERWDTEAAAAKIITPRLEAERDAACAEVERLREALELIASLHIPSVPVALADSYTDLEWAQRHVGNLRGIARAALAAKENEQ